MAIGYYRAKQLESPSPWVRWTHGARYAKAVQFVCELKPRSVLDYGCGDGTFVAMIAGLVSLVVAADCDEWQVAECRNVNGHLKNLRIVSIADIPPGVEYDAIFCTEVLEHLPEPELEHALANLRRLVAPGGRVIISVPIETGPPLVAKYLLRRLLGLYRIGEYQFSEAYSLRELLKMAFAHGTTACDRPVYGGHGALYYSHKGFNWKILRARLQDRFRIERTTFSPLPWSRGLASSQAWFVCRPKD
jgi:2-polyprenyl-3-methyl-5-hydroxy-6-metoxy-1,4-benzoquinol methylase